MLEDERRTVREKRVQMSGRCTGLWFKEEARQEREIWESSP